MGKVELEPTEVVIVDEEGSPMSGMTLKLTFELTEEVRRVVTDKDGVARFVAPAGSNIVLEALVAGELKVVEEAELDVIWN